MHQLSCDRHHRCQGLALFLVGLVSTACNTSSRQVNKRAVPTTTNTKSEVRPNILQSMWNILWYCGFSWLALACCQLPGADLAGKLAGCLEVTARQPDTHNVDGLQLVNQLACFLLLSNLQSDWTCYLFIACQMTSPANVMLVRSAVLTMSYSRWMNHIVH